MHSQEFIEEMKQSLIQKKEELEGELEGLHSHTEVGDELDEAATEFQMDEVSQDVMATLKKDLIKIDAALANIKSGTYGVDDSGKEISEARLRVIPWADTSI